MPAAGAFLSNTSLVVYAFLIAKIAGATAVVHTCFCFFARKNCNAGTAADVLVAGAFLSNRSLAVFAFLIAKIVTREKQLVRLVIHMCFHFFACKKSRAGAATGLLAAGASLSNISLAVFAFLIAKMITRE